VASLRLKQRTSYGRKQLVPHPPPHQATPARCFVFLYAELGKLDLAFERLDRTYESHDTGLMALRVMPLYQRLRIDSRYQQMLRRPGIPRNVASSLESVHTAPVMIAP
jgi:hypothetical protein